MTEVIHWRSYEDLLRDTRGLLAKIPHDVAAVYGVPRSGLLPATILATALGAPMFTRSTGPLGGSRMNWDIANLEDEPVLVVDDSAFTGRAMQEEVKLWATWKKIHTVALYVTPEARDVVSLYADVVPAPRIFEWNFTHCDATEQMLWDMDGAICEDPKEWELEDHPEYARELPTLAPLYVPRRSIRGIVTNRIERHRVTTAEWLLRHGVECQDDGPGLVMQPHESAEARRQDVDARPGLFKGRVYAEDTGAALFVESDDRQARDIHAVSGKPVLSIQSKRIYQ